MNLNLRYRGFSLIELLVVISIIGILVTVLTASLSEARENARNKALRTTLSETQLAIELYKAQNGQYPATASGGSLPAGCRTQVSIGAVNVSTTFSNSCGNIQYINGLVPNYIAGLPTHQASGNNNCVITYSTDDGRTFYKLTALNCYEGATEAAEGIKQDDEFARCPSTCAASGACVPNNAEFYNSMAVYSAGGECL